MSVETKRELFEGTAALVCIAMRHACSKQRKWIEVLEKKVLRTITSVRQFHNVKSNIACVCVCVCVCVKETESEYWHK